jgi:hypothetical protein
MAKTGRPSHAQTLDLVYVPADIPYMSYNPGNIDYCIAIVARADPSERENVVLLPCCRPRRSGHACRRRITREGHKDTAWSAVASGFPSASLFPRSQMAATHAIDGPMAATHVCH